MSCERPSGIGISLMRDANIKFPANFSGDLPPAETREELAKLCDEMIRKRGFSADQVIELLDFLEKYEARYYEAPGGKCYHRDCGGGAIVQGELGVHCAKCGKLSDLLPPAFMR